MARRQFGWSYPPGCSGTQFDEDDGVSPLQESVLELLETAGIPTETNDAIMKLIYAAEIAQIPDVTDEQS